MVFLFVGAGIYEWLLGVEWWGGGMGIGIKGGFMFKRMLANFFVWGGQMKC